VKEGAFIMTRLRYCIAFVLLLCCTSLFSTAAALAPEAAEKPEASADQPPKPEAPAEGSLFRHLIGEHQSFKVDGFLQMIFSENNLSTGQQKLSGGSSLPVAAQDEGFYMNFVYMSVHKDAMTNIIPHFGPIPVPMPAKFSWGYSVDTAFARSYGPLLGGWDLNWGVNAPGAKNKAVGETSKQNFVVQPNVNINAYLPLLKGMYVIFGRFPGGIGMEIPPPVRLAPNRFATNTYALIAQPDQFFGFLTGLNLYRGSAGMLAAEFSVNSGWQTVHSPNGDLSYLGALRWKSPHMLTSADYAFIIGNGQISPSKNPLNYPYSKVVSPNSLLLQYHSLRVAHAFSPKWQVQAEGVVGKQEGDGKASTILLRSIGAAPGFTGASWSGFNADATYRKRANLAYNVRYEYFNDGDGFRLPSGFASQGIKSSYNDITAGLKYDYNKYFQFRPELRYDWQPTHKNGYAYNNGTASAQWTGTCDFIVFF
jgi:hypothetical protein